MNKIQFFSADHKVDIRKPNVVKIFLTKLFDAEFKSLKKVAIIFCSDEFLFSINSKYLKHNFYTDVITFEFSNKGQPIDGEVYISSDRIKANAQKYGTTYQTELLRVIIHGSLHLSGYKDKTSLQKKNMTKKENHYLNLFHVK